jgi:hypothetical protein
MCRDNERRRVKLESNEFLKVYGLACESFKRPNQLEKQYVSTFRGKDDWDEVRLWARVLPKSFDSPYRWRTAIHWYPDAIEQATRELNDFIERADAYANDKVISCRS